MNIKIPERISKKNRVNKEIIIKEVVNNEIIKEVVQGKSRTHVHNDKISVNILFQEYSDHYRF